MTEREIFTAALNQENAAQRALYLDKACGGDAALRQRVELLLRENEQMGSFLESPADNRPPIWDENHGMDRTSDIEVLPPPDAEIPLDFLAPSQDPKVLGRIGPYEVTERIGRGGMGIVLKARDAKLNRVVAIKVMAPELAVSATARKRFVREAQAAAAVVHQHVVTIHAVDEDRLPYLVMEYIDGQSLQQKIDREGQPKLIEILRIGQQVASGLAAAHAHGLMHRDVKPANILLENGVERVRITDFGLARAVDDVGMTRTGEVAGTPQYMSPEQAQGLPMDARSDLFSLGCVLYAMCTGRPPFRAETAFATARRVCEDTPRPIREVNPEVPQWLVEIIDRMLAKQPGERFQSAAEVAELLSRHLAEVQHPSTAGQAVGDTLRGVPRTGRNATERVPYRIAHGWAIAASVLLCLIVGLGLAEATGTTQLAATVIRILTPHGTLVVAVDDPSVKVTIEGDGGLTITGAGLEEIRLRPGSYKVHADKNGQPIPLETDVVSIAKGGREVVKVKLEAAGTGPTPTAEGFTPLFNGKDLTGWASAQGGTGMWRIEDGALTCTGPRDHLLTIRNDFGDFHLRAEVKINANGNSGIYFRTGKPLVLVGDYEAQITDNPGQQYKTGSLYGLVGLSESPVPPETWFTYEIIAIGQRIRVLVNGTQTADYTEDRAGRNAKGHIALQHHDPETRVSFRRIEIKELSPGKSAEKGAFVLVGGQGVAEHKFDTLIAAVQAASDGDTIEVRGNGPFVCDGINITQALTIRAGEGFRPVINLTVAPKPLRQGGLIPHAPLVLEGLEFRVLDPDEMNGKVTHTVIVPLKALRVANCRFSTAFTCFADFSTSPSSVFEFRNCEFLGSNQDSRAVSAGFASGQKVILENCVSTMRCAIDGGVLTPKEPTFQLTRNTFRAFPCAVEFVDKTDKTRDLDDAKKGNNVLRVEASGNLFDSNQVLVFSQHPLGKYLSPADAEIYLAQVVGWKGERNLYSVAGQFLTLWSIEKGFQDLAKPIKTLVDWKQFWTTAEDNSIEGVVRYQGGDLLAKVKLSPEKVTPEDFRLHRDSPGYRAGKDKKDLGADVDLVGPGPAYERWKKTPEYQQWLKDTGQVTKAEAPKVEPTAFVVLGGTGVAERKFNTLAEAVQRASDGDTVEIRGNGPFMSDTVNILGRALTIRAGAGFRPVIKLSREAFQRDEPLLATNAALVLEGLELHRGAPEDPANGRLAFIITHQAPLRAANCRFSAAIFTFHSPLWLFLNCEFLAAGGVSGTSRSAARIVFENCLRHRKTFPLSLAYDDLALRDVSIEIKRSTFLGDYTLHWLRLQSPLPVRSDDPQAPKAFRFEVSESIFDAPTVLGFDQKPESLEKSAVLPLADAEAALLGLFQWRGERNVFAAGSTCVRWAADGKLLPPRGPKSLEEWKQFWGTAETDSLEGGLRFQGGDLPLAPDDFRLRADSAGYRAAADGKDLGADVDLVGPGPAYERWKKTPEYEQWLKETGQVSGQ